MNCSSCCISLSSTPCLLKSFLFPGTYCTGVEPCAGRDNFWPPPPTFVDRRAAAAADNLSARRRYHCCCVVIFLIFDNFFFKFFALWKVQTSNGFMFLDVEQIG